MTRGWPFTVHSAVNPGDLAVNLRFKTSHVLHPRARDAMGQLMADVQMAVADWDTAVLIAETRYFNLDLLFWFSTLGNDIDGPIKRSIDCLERGMRDVAIPFKDSRIMRLGVEKQKSPLPHMRMVLWSWEG